MFSCEGAAPVDLLTECIGEEELKDGLEGIKAVLACVLVWAEVYLGTGNMLIKVCYADNGCIDGSVVSLQGWIKLVLIWT